MKKQKQMKNKVDLLKSFNGGSSVGDLISASVEMVKSIGKIGIDLVEIPVSLAS